ncbi:MAG TPA: glycosyltransferase family 2 protein [Candidatus Pelethocola excrementipullorum]|nr:glycosyltransferase family 2 protein [Candidatus Pelethocola excrementipullorum]
MYQFMITILAIYTTYMLFVFCSYVFFVILLPKSKKTDYFNHGIDKDFITYLIIPCLNEEAVIEKTLKSLLSNAPQNLKIYVIDDASDDRTAEIVNEYPDERVHLFRRKAPDARAGKGKALNACYAHIAKEIESLNYEAEDVIVGVFDADAHISEDHYDIIKKYFQDSKVGAVQSRIKMVNTDNLLQKMQNYEFQVEITAIQNSREYLDSVCMGGNGQYIRFTALQSLDGEPWDTCLLEDFEIGLKILLKGWQTKFAIEADVEQQAIKNYYYFVRQRSRWIQGNMQARKYSRDILDSKLSKLAKLDLIYFLTQSWKGILGILVTIFYTYILGTIFESIIINAQLTGFQEVGVNLLLMIIILNYIPTLALYVWKIKNCYRKGEWKLDIFCIFLNPVYRIMMYPATLIAFKREVFGQKGWIKTKRNV